MSETTACPECGDGTLDIVTDGLVGTIEKTGVRFTESDTNTEGPAPLRQSFPIPVFTRVERQRRFAACNMCEFTHEF